MGHRLKLESYGHKKDKHASRRALYSAGRLRRAHPTCRIQMVAGAPQAVLAKALAAEDSG